MRNHDNYKNGILSLYMQHIKFGWPISFVQKLVTCFWVTQVTYMQKCVVIDNFLKQALYDKCWFWLFADFISLTEQITILTWKRKIYSYWFVISKFHPNTFNLGGVPHPIVLFSSILFYYFCFNSRVLFIIELALPVEFPKHNRRFFLRRFYAYFKIFQIL